MNDSISRQAAIDAIFSEPLYESGMKKRDADAVVPAIYEKIKSLPSAQPDWGKPVGDGRPLADSEVIPRLQEIKRLIGGSYAIDRAIEVLEWLRGEQDG